MGYIIEITEDKVESLSEHLEKGLRHIGKAMQCLEEFSSGEEMGERRMDYDDYGEEDMGRRGGYNRGGYGERRGVRGTGRYSRYR